MRTKTNWIQTYEARQFWPTAPALEDIGIHDIAHALSNLCRYGGHTEWFYSVAQHCVLVSESVPEKYALYGLLHDASEAYLVDVPRPIKHEPEMGFYRSVEHGLQSLIYSRFGLDPHEPECLKVADNQLLVTEQRDLMKPPPVAWTDYHVRPLEHQIIPLLPSGAKMLFMDRYHRLTA